MPALRIVFWVGLGARLRLVDLDERRDVLVDRRGAGRGSALLQAAGARRCSSCRAALADGARQALPVGLACALVGIVIGTMTLTGLGTIIGNVADRRSAATRSSSRWC